MSKLTLKNVTITYPATFTGDPTDAQLVEWLEYGLGLRNDIELSNPLCELELRDADIKVGQADIDGKLISL